MITQLTPKTEIVVTDQWHLGTLNLDSLLPEICKTMAEAITNSLADDPPDLWLIPREEDALSVELCLPALGEYGECPEYQTSIAALVRNECQSVEEDHDPNRARNMTRVAAALRQLAEEVDASVLRFYKSHPQEEEQ